MQMLFNMRYNGNCKQWSGEDWRDISMTYFKARFRCLKRLQQTMKNPQSYYQLKLNDYFDFRRNKTYCIRQKSFLICWQTENSQSLWFYWVSKTQIHCWLQQLNYIAEKSCIALINKLQKCLNRIVNTPPSQQSNCFALQAWPIN